MTAMGPTVLVTQREWDVIALIHAGFIEKEVAPALGIGYASVKSHVQKIHRKMRDAGVPRTRNVTMALMFERNQFAISARSVADLGPYGRSDQSAQKEYPDSAPRAFGALADAAALPASAEIPAVRSSHASAAGARLSPGASPGENSEVG